METTELMEGLEKLAYQKTTPFCYGCYIEAPTGVCLKCHSDDLMRQLEGVGVEWGTEWVIKSLLEAELTPVDTDEAYEQMLNEVYSEPVTVCGMEMDQVRILKELDPIAFQVGCSDWISSEIDETIVDIGGYYWINEIEDFLQENLKDEDEK